MKKNKNIFLSYKIDNNIFRNSFRWDKKLSENILVVAQGNDNQQLFNNKLSVDSINWICEPDLTEPIKLKAKIRYRQDDQECILSKKGKTFSVEFKKPQRAITPGQSIVFYQDNICFYI